MHGPMILYESTIFYAFIYRSVSTFHRQSRYGAKNLSFSTVEAVIRRLSASIHTVNIETRVLEVLECCRRENALTF